MDPTPRQMTFRPTDQTKTLRNLVRKMPELASCTEDYASGSVILEEGEPNDRLFVLTEGRATLGKLDERGEVVEVDAFGPGSILGLTSFWMREPVFAQVRAATEASCISIERSVFDELVARYPEFSRSVQYLFVSNLSDRYRHLVQSHVERARLSRQLEEERNQLRDTLSKLETATKRLINQEKLATMGQLLAGIAHEINNPIGALTSSSKAAEEALVAFFGIGKNAASLGRSFREGLHCPYWSAEERSDRMEALKKQYPDFKRSFIKQLSQMTGIAFGIWEKASGDEARRMVLEAFNVGMFLRSVRITGGRIEKLVIGLKNYGKQTGDTWVEVDLREGIGDTLTVLNNRLKRYEVLLDFKELPQIACNVGEMNQVWTNLLVNAMDATEEGGKIWVSCEVTDGRIEVRIQDSGSGIAADKLEKIFEPNYTTKNTSGSFGLGLGLSISDEIVRKHGGTISAGNATERGAIFSVRLPC